MKSLKKIELNDILEVASMLRDFWKSQLATVNDNDILEDIRRMLDPECISYLVCYDNDIAGFVFVNEKYGFLIILNIFILKKNTAGKDLEHIVYHLLWI